MSNEKEYLMNNKTKRYLGWLLISPTILAFLALAVYNLCILPTAGLIVIGVAICGGLGSFLIAESYERN